MMMEALKAYSKALGEVLRTFDPNKMRQFIDENRDLYQKGMADAMLSQDDTFIRGMMAKMVMNRTDMSLNDRNKAKAILNEMGWDESIL